MAHTAHQNEEDKVQYFDTEEELGNKINILAELIVKSKYFTAFTGAGISTSCGIPDFRSGTDTVLKIGPCTWEKQAQQFKKKPNKNVVNIDKAIPSFTHMALLELQREGYLKYIISQNTDGLHVRSGFDTNKLAQLHGNRSLQKCRKCSSQYFNDFKTKYRKCQKCGDNLHDSRISFGQKLPEYELAQGFEQAEKSDLCLVLGSSLSVTPAADMPAIVGKKGKLIIVNLQKTPLDKLAFMRINGLCDDVMKRLAAKLDLKVKNFTLERLINFKLNKNQQLEFRGVDHRKIPFSFFNEVSVTYDKEKVAKKLEGQPYVISLEKREKAKVKLDFYGHLGQPSYEIEFDKERQGVLKIIYDPQSREWVDEKWLEQDEKKEQPKKEFEK